MKLVVLGDSTVTYDEIRVSSFAPQVDVTSASIPINSFVVEAKTSDTIKLGVYAKLTDDAGNLWAKYRIIKVEKMGRGWQRVTAESPISILDTNMLPATFWDGTDTVYDTIANMFDIVRIQSGAYYIDPDLRNVMVSGFTPEQTPRERLQALLITCGAYVIDTGAEMIRIYTSANVVYVNQVPFEKTFWRPTLEQGNIVTRIEVTAYTVREGEAQTGEDSVTDANGVEYRVTKTVIGMNNPASNQNADPPNVVRVDNVMLVNQSNASTVAVALAQRYFVREELTFDCINNGEYWAGDKVAAFFDEEQAYAGFAESVTYKFGLQTRSTIKIVGVASIEVAALTVIRKCGTKEIGKKVYRLPVGAPYDIECEYLVKSDANHKYVYRPLQDRITGTLPSGGATVIVQHETALDLNTTNHVLKVISVDEVEVDETQETVDGSTVLIRTAVIA